MVKMLRTLLLIAIAVWWGSSCAEACDDFVEISTEQMKLLRDKLVEEQADPLDKLYAFENLSCSDNPTVRAFAVKTALEKSSDPLLRQQVMLEALLQKTRLDIELSGDSKSPAGDKDFIGDNAGVWSRSVVFTNREKGCISVYDGRSCASSGQLVVKGDMAELTAGNLVGTFRLTDQNELVGFVRAYPSPKYGRIPAVIRLF